MFDGEIARLGLVGPNGCAKTTLLRSICGRLPSLAGSYRLAPGLRPGYLSQEGEELDPGLDALDHLLQAVPMTQAEARRFVHRYLFAGDDVFIAAGQRPYGEGARLSLALLAAQAAACSFWISRLITWISPPGPASSKPWQLFTVQP